ncbi:hypothetical protein ACIQGO_13320 [Streptomyces shenzhenensis]
MQTSQNLGQTVVLALASALFSAVSAAGGQLTPFGWAFALLVLPAMGAACLAGRTRMADLDRQRAPERAATACHRLSDVQPSE